jgi:RNA polymerase sigma-70 factor (ECF subfamily)
MLPSIVEKRTSAALDAFTPASSEMTEWARSAAEGDTAATARLLKAMAPRMIRAVRALMGPAHPDVEDVIQQALIAIVQALPRFRGECSPMHYASRIVVRTAVHARHRARKQASGRVTDVEVDAVPFEETQVDEELRSERQRARVRALIDELPPEQGEVIALRIGLGLSWEEMAAATGVPLNTLRSRIRRAKEGIRRRIEEDPALAAELEVDA